MTRKLTVTVEVSDGHDYGSMIRAGAGEPSTRSSYEVNFETPIRADVTFDDIEQAVERFRSFALGQSDR